MNRRLRELSLHLSFKRSIQGKIFAVISLVTLSALVLVGLAIYYSMTSDIKRNATHYVTDSMRRADENVNVVAQDAARMLAMIVTDPSVADVLESSHSDLSIEGYRERRQIGDFLRYLMAYKSTINRISIVSLRNGRIFYEGAPYVDRTNFNRSLVEQIVAAPSDKPFIRQYYDGSEETVAIGRPIVQNRQTIGVAIIDLNDAILANNYSMEPLENSDIFVLDANGGIVFHSPRSGLANPSAARLNLLRSDRQTSHVSEVRLDGSKQLVVGSYSEFTGWRTVGIVPIQSLMRDSVVLRERIIALLVLVYLLVLLVSVAVASQITRHLRRLRNAMQEVREGSFPIMEPIRSQDEVGHFYRTFESMLNRLRELMDEIRHREQLKREAELTALQAQIRPHFLYNSLNTIKYLAALNGVRNIEEVSESLIDVLRGVLGNTKEFITLREELAYVQSYVTIQKYKYANRFQIRYEIDPDLLDACVLKLTVQPLVENAISHGIGNLSSDGIVAVRAYREDGLLVIEVSDNGNGMTKAQIEAALRPDTINEHFRRGGMGLRNVNERIRMVYGSDYGLRIYSRPDTFTKAELRIPL